MKKVVVLLVDSLMPNILEDCIRHKTVPALQFLKDRGRYWNHCVTVFPTMTASVDSSLVTGVYPDLHRVPGLVWYDPDKQAIINYINGWKCIQKLGLSNCVKNVLRSLNEEHLSKKVTTLFEDLANRGLTSASINAIVHRGANKHQLQLPYLIDLATRGKVHGEISGPDFLTMGAFVKNGVNQKIPPQLHRAKNKYGINDGYAIATVKSLINEQNQPDFMLVYLPDNDHEVHLKNPAHAEEALIRVDRKIQELLYAYGSWEEALKRNVFIIISDHGQTRIGKEREFNIDLDQLLQPFKVLELGEKLKDHDVIVANNERMAYVYPLHRDREEEMIHTLSVETRIDIIAWKEGNGIRAREGGSGREIYYEKGGTITDCYGCLWSISGDWMVLDLMDKQGVIEYGDYPDVLSRLYGALFSQDIPMVVINARPRYEFKSRFYPMHLNGGSHGSLHKYDSVIPLIVAGTELPVKEPPRLVDLKDYILTLFDSDTAAVN